MALPPRAKDDLEVLTAVEAGEIVSQLALSRRVGIAVGLMNALLKRAIRKGYVKARSAPAKRYAYYLTPKGFTEKSRLVAEYLDASLAFFRDARAQYLELFQRASALGQKRIVLAGAGEIAEIAALAASEADIRLLALFDPRTNQDILFGLPVIRSLNELERIDLAVVTDHLTPQDCYDRLIATLGSHRVMAPAFLRISERGLLSKPDHAQREEP